MSKRMDSIAPQRAEETPITPITPEPTTLPVVVEKDTYESLFPEPVVAVSAPPTWVWWSLLGVATLGLGILAYNVANGKVSAWLSPASTPNSQATGVVSTAIPLLTPAVTTSPTPTATPTAPSAVTIQPTSSPTATTTVRILNGTSSEGAATRAKTAISTTGFTVSGVGNAKSTYTATVIYYQPGYIESAKAVAKALTKYSSTIQESQTQASPDSILVILGPAN